MSWQNIIQKHIFIKFVYIEKVALIYSFMTVIRLRLLGKAIIIGKKQTKGIDAWNIYLDFLV